jgi:hypothetical protein
MHCAVKTAAMLCARLFTQDEYCGLFPYEHSSSAVSAFKTSCRKTRLTVNLEAGQMIPVFIAALPQQM